MKVTKTNNPNQSSDATAKPRKSHTAKSRLPELQLHIREAAYFKALERGFKPGHELDDWLAAEQEATQ
ncbi:MAG: DUF2934 domain-containing protein [Burkholderiales bacterium]|uniref:DUF2934 domain-containing protein n=1 Tax=Nitrosomonas sp. TaxID=42353 RepID=UPI001D54DD71|nr:DUF2934 domain-containing protein [Nitrosomonas sp.]MCB1948769.1 DUF2934 domain-containing protein [Nitrosomonas sp.]MCP5241907.1 DUF2934 domain-containing protein [Burkholderiales bacterium]